MSRTNRQWLLARRPHGALAVSDFRYREAPLPEPDLASGEVLLQNRWLGFDATQRLWVTEAEGYMPPVEIGAVMRGATISEVLRSSNPALPEGSLVQGVYGWQDYAIARTDDPIPPMPLHPGVTPGMALAVLGATGLTAYFGLTGTGALAPGETVLVSAAAGATGSLTVQIARLLGARVVGIAGGAEKCAWVRETLGADAVIDYKHESVDARLAELCPAGVDLYFDNVGGSILESAIARIAPRGRIVLCGQIAGYEDAAPPGPRNLMTLIMRRARMEGFLVLDYIPRAGEAMERIAGWLMEGKLAWNEDVQEGFDNIPRTLMRLFRGENRGKQMLKI
jgi:hypothetical protein